jgi:hypothetical protein
MEVIERREPTDESVQLCNGRLRLDDDIVPLVSRAAFLLPSEPIPNGTDLLRYVVASLVLFGPDCLPRVRPTIRANLLRRIPLKAISFVFS